MKAKYFEVLSENEIETIHSASMELLSSVGIKFDSEDVQNLFKDHGAEVDPQTNFVKIPESLIKEQLKHTPKSFKLYGPDGSFNFEVNTMSTKFATIGTPVKIFDPTRKSGLRKVVLKDNIEQLRVIDRLENINCSHIDIWPSDVKFTSVHTHCIDAWAKNTHKPYGLGCLGKVVSQDTINMGEIIVGSKEELTNKPRFVGFMNPTSPLQIPKLMTNGFAIFAKYKQPTIVAPEALTGTTAPVTLAGLLTQTNAEIIGGIVLGQLFNPGAPVFFGTVSNTTDMRSGNSAIGAIETGLITAGIAQLARFYDIPSRGPGGATDSKIFDIQSGFERFQTLMLAAQAGINYITCAGTYEATLVESLELLVIDDELCSIVLRALEGVEVNEDTIALDVIKKVATSTKKGTNYLSEAHTRKYMKKELYIPKLIDRNRRATWRKRGAKDIIERARDRVNEILSSFEPPKLSSEVEFGLKEYIKMVEQRSFEYYKEAEGISEGSVSIGEIEIKTDDK